MEISDEMEKNDSGNGREDKDNDDAGDCDEKKIENGDDEL